MSQTIRLNIALLLLAALPAWSDDAAQLDRYLQKLGLNDLRLVHQHKQLAATGDDAAKSLRAKELSDLYAQRLLETAENPERFNDLVARVEQLIRDYPAVDSPQLHVMLLQAEYQRAEAKALHWLDDPGNAAARREAQQLLDKLAPQLQQRREELAKSLEELQTRFDSAEEAADAKNKRSRSSPGTTVSLEQELTRLQAVLARALFFEGWARFFAGLAAERQQAEQFAAAEKAFAQLLEISTEEKLNLEPETMGLDSIWRARSLLGLAATLSASDKEGLALECFQALAHPAAAPAVRDSALYWHLLALVGTERWSVAQELAAAELGKLAPGQTAGTPACVLLVRTGWANPRAAKEAELLARVGLEGLARLRQFDVLTALLAKYRPDPKPSDGFYALWGKGRLVFAEAEKSKAAADYAAAAKWFQQALDLPEAKDDPAAAAQCRYSLAWCDYRTEKYDTAIRLFRQAADQLKTLGDDTAVQSAWMVFTCYQQMFADTKDPRHQKGALDALADLKRDFSGSEQAQKADLMLARMSARNDSPEAAVKTLSAVPSDSPNYLTARFELCVARHQLWAKVRGTDKGKAHAGEVRKDVDAYLVAAPDSEGVRRLRAALLAIDVLLGDGKPDWDEAAKYLQRVQGIGDKLADDDTVAPEYHYRRLQLAQHAKDDSQIRRSADWLARHAAGTNYELPALVIVAREADEAYAAASTAEKQPRREAAIAAYARLVELIGESSDVIAAKKNAQVANSKLAQYEFDAGQYKSSANRLEELVRAFPADRNYLRRAGLAWFQAGDFGKSLPHWDTIVAGTDSASEAWYEAKYYQLVCLTKTDVATAGKLWRQFKLLHPEVKSAAWKDKFAELEKTLK